MPELPEVETTLRGIRPHIIDQSVKAVVVRQRQLRVPVSRGLKSKLKDQVVRDIERRAKYLLFHFDCGTLAIHLGMSGRLRVISHQHQSTNMIMSIYYSRMGHSSDFEIQDGSDWWCGLVNAP